MAFGEMGGYRPDLRSIQEPKRRQSAAEARGPIDIDLSEDVPMVVDHAPVGSKRREWKQDSKPRTPEAGREVTI